MRVRALLKRAAVFILVASLLFLVMQGYGQRTPGCSPAELERYSDQMRNYLYEGDSTSYNYLLDSLRAEAYKWNDSLLLIQCHLWSALSRSEVRDFAAAFHSVTEALQCAQDLRDTVLLCDVYYTLGLVYQDCENYMGALAAYREVVKMESPTHPLPLRRKFAILNNSAVIYAAQDDYATALSYYNMALAIEDPVTSDFHPRLLCNMAVLAEFLHDTVQELSYLYRAYPLAEYYKDTTILLDVHVFLSRLYAHMGRTDWAKEELYNYHIKYDNYKKYSYEMAPYCSDLMEVYMTLGDYKKATEYVNTVYRCLDGERPFDIYEEFLLRRSKLASLQGDYKCAVAFLDSSTHFKLRKDIVLHVFLFGEKVLGGVNLLAHNEELVRKFQRENELREQKQNRRMFFLTLSFFLFAFILLQRYFRVHSKILRRTHEELMTESEYARQLSQKWTSLEKVLNNQQADLEQTTALLHFLLGMLHSNSEKLNENILFVKNIQQVLLPNMELIEKAFGESFLVYMPRDVVSGDFYWYASDGEYELLALVDCAGHGVPGALMSLIGHVLLNKIVKEWHINDPAQVLTTLHEQIHQNLGYQSTSYLGHYSMDLSVVRYSSRARELVFSSASSSVYITTPEGITRYRGSIMSAGSMLANRPYVNVTYSHLQPIWLYLTSDGFVDQLNEESRKFGNMKFQETLRHLYDVSAVEQHRSLVETLNSHMGNAEQADDICVIGIHFL